MKKQMLLFTLLAMILSPHAYAALTPSIGLGCSNVSSCAPYGGISAAYSPELSASCITSSLVYYSCPDGCISVRECTGCSDTAVLLSKSLSVVLGQYSVSYRVCSTDCASGCEDCEDTAWRIAGYGTNVYSRTLAVCNALTCTCSKRTVYGCRIGYYGTPTSSSGVCTKCPQHTDDEQYGTTDGIGNTISAGCYITNGSDEKGTYGFTGGKCSYE